MITPRPFQERTFTRCIERYEAGARSLLVVIPTGGGKTVLAEMMAERTALTTLFVVHGLEIVNQTAERFRRLFGQVDVIDANSNPTGARVTVASVDTLIARGLRPPAELVIYDEAHRAPADECRAVLDHYAGSRILGLSATPARADGRALGDVFGELIVGATYSELIRDKFLLPCRVFRPGVENLTSGLAQDPVAAYERHAKGTLAVAFLPSVKLAYEQAERFTAAGYPAACIEANTGREERRSILGRFRRGELRVLTNMSVLTEGVDIPQIETVILGKAFNHVAGYLQAVGRVLRPHGDMQHAICIDLTGASHHHGLPTEDRFFSLEGEPIRRVTTEPLHVCTECGATFPSAMRVCPVCGDERPYAGPKPPKIYSFELQEVWAGADTPAEAKQRELDRLKRVANERGYPLSWVSDAYLKTFSERPELGVDTDEEHRTLMMLLARADEKGWGLYFVSKKFRETFGYEPNLYDLPKERKLAELRKLVQRAAERGYKPGWAKFQYKTLFGGWPSAALIAEAQRTPPETSP